MSEPAEVTKRNGRPAAVIGLAVLLIGAVLTAGLTTVYLLSHRTVATTLPPAVVQQPHFRMLLVEQGILWRVAPDGTRKQIAVLPASMGTIRHIAAAPDGSRLLFITGPDSAQSAWIWDAPTARPRQLLEPELASAPRHYLAYGWSDAGTLTFLIAQGTSVWSVRMSAAPPVHENDRSVLLKVRPAEVLSLSPNGRQLALEEARPGTDVFGAQQAIKLQHIVSGRSSIAYQYLGASTPTALLWSTDNGTVAVFRGSTGLALQKSSGRPVLTASTGSLPAVFSSNAEFAYTAQSDRAWQIHLVTLHNEIDRQIGPLLRTAPQELFWTPDNRTLLIRSGNVLWCLDPSSGSLQKLSTNVVGTSVGITSPGQAFSQ